MSKLYSLIKFVEFTHKFHQIKRLIMAAGEDRQENDAEHSFQLALVAWYLIEKEKLSLDKDLVIKYALVHDLVEIYAGDTYTFEKDNKVVQSKTDRERIAAEKIKEQFPDFHSLFQLIQKYESREDDESNYIYSLDKLLSELNDFIDNGRTKKWLGITEEEVVKRGEKTRSCPFIHEYYSELLELINTSRQGYFGKS